MRDLKQIVCSHLTLRLRTSQYLDATRPDTLEGLPSFESFIKRQPVLDTLSHEFDKVDMATITPLQKLEPDGMALNEEVQEVVAKRNGSVLTAYTMLKSDMFPGLVSVAFGSLALDHC